MKIIKIGTWDENGMPINWHFMEGDEISISEEHGVIHVAAGLRLEPDGRVLVNGIEIVPWTEERKKASHLLTPINESAP